jgi:hypothetical protein
LFVKTSKKICSVFGWHFGNEILTQALIQVMPPALDITLHKKTLLGEETQVDDGIFWDQTTGLREHG